MNPEETDLGASKPVPQPPAPKPQPLQLPVVIACGHKLNMTQPPSHANCPACWEAFLTNNPDGVGMVHKLLMEQGTQAVVKLYGKKFLKQFGAYLRKQLLQQYASDQVKAASGIEGSIMDIKAERTGNEPPSRVHEGVEKKEPQACQSVQQ